MIFKRPWDFAEIDRLLTAEWPRFSALVHTVTGQRRTWDATLDELCELFDAYEKSGRDAEPLYRIFDTLVARCYSAPDAETAIGMLKTMGEKLSFDVSRQIEEGIRYYRTDPATRKNEEARKWLADYHAKFGRKMPDPKIVTGAALWNNRR